jgi:benzodiazapine receptor
MSTHSPNHADDSGFFRPIAGLAVWLAICYGAAALGSVFSVGAIPGWYETLTKPPGTPPNAVFGPVWTVLYGMMGVAAWRVWLLRGLRGAWGALALFAVQLGLNVGWSALFFGRQAIAAAMIEIVLLWCAIAATTVAFLRHDRLAAALLAPYWAWVSFAAWLNYGFWRLNG